MMADSRDNDPGIGAEQPAAGMPFAHATVLEVLSMAARDRKFLVRLAANPHEVLREYDLTPEERTALALGQLEKIERWVGKLDYELETWFRVRRSQYRW